MSTALRRHTMIVIALTWAAGTFGVATGDRRRRTRGTARRLDRRSYSHDSRPYLVEQGLLDPERLNDPILVTMPGWGPSLRQQVLLLPGLDKIHPSSLARLQAVQRKRLHAHAIVLGSLVGSLIVFAASLFLVWVW